MEDSENTSTLSTTPTKDSKTQSKWPASFSEEDKVKVMQAKAIVELHSWSIEPGEMHENNGAVVDWINKNIKIIEDFDEKTKRAKG